MGGRQPFFRCLKPSGPFGGPILAILCRRKKGSLGDILSQAPTRASRQRPAENGHLTRPPERPPPATSSSYGRNSRKPFLKRFPAESLTETLSVPRLKSRPPEACGWPGRGLRPAVATAQPHTKNGGTQFMQTFYHNGAEQTGRDLLGDLMRSWGELTPDEAGAGRR